MERYLCCTYQALPLFEGSLSMLAERGSQVDDVGSERYRLVSGHNGLTLRAYLLGKDITTNPMGRTFVTLIVTEPKYAEDPVLTLGWAHILFPQLGFDGIDKLSRPIAFASRFNSTATRKGG